MDSIEHDAQVRSAAFAFLNEQRLLTGGDLPFTVLSEGFTYQGQRVPLIGPQGIFKPKVLSQPIPLSITTAPRKPGKERPYEDSVRGDGLIEYKYRGTDPDHHENVGLRLAMEHQVPLVYFEGLEVGWYAAAYPCFVVGDNPRDLSVTVAADVPLAQETEGTRVGEPLVEARRAYATRTARYRMHQDRFRHNVLLAYRESCAICTLKQRPLLEAAHIIPDRELRGVPEVSNGLSLCKLHHAAFDANIVGIRPLADQPIVEIRSDVLKQKDGPMLIHGLQECHGKPLLVIPRTEALRPSRELLEERYEQFRRAI
jgi:putative restriction endonuclease